MHICSHACNQLCFIILFIWIMDFWRLPFPSQDQYERSKCFHRFQVYHFCLYTTLLLSTLQVSQSTHIHISQNQYVRSNVFKLIRLQVYHFFFFLDTTVLFINFASELIHTQMFPYTSSVETFWLENISKMTTARWSLFTSY